jgi:hypothetical protein
MKSEEHVRQASGNLIQQELFRIFNTQIKKKEKTVSIDDFDKILKKEAGKKEKALQEHSH